MKSEQHSDNCKEAETTYNMEKPDKVVKVKKHGTAYFIDMYARLAGYPMLKDGSLDRGTEVPIEQSPDSFKARHEKALRKLGAPENLIPLILKHVHYY